MTEAKQFHRTNMAGIYDPDTGKRTSLFWVVVCFIILSVLGIICFVTVQKKEGGVGPNGGCDYDDDPDGKQKKTCRIQQGVGGGLLAIGVIGGAITSFIVWVKRAKYASKHPSVGSVASMLT